MTRYLANCFLLILPVLVWNLLLTQRLPPVFMPAIFDKDIPPAISAGEAVTRAVVLGMPLLMPLRMHTAAQWAGLGIYLAGLLGYALSWLMQIYAPHSAWSTSAAGFLAPEYTPLLWLTGIALIGGSLFLPVPYQWWYFLIPVVAFVGFHTWHALIVYHHLPAAPASGG